MIGDLWSRFCRLTCRKHARRRVLGWSSRPLVGEYLSVRLQFEPLEDRQLLSVTPAGVEFRVNTWTSNTQNVPSVASSASGNFVVVWESDSQNENLRGVFGQRFDAIGLPLGNEFHVNTYTTLAQARTMVAMADNGAFVVVWQSNQQDSGVGYGIYAQRYDAAGVEQGGEFRVNSYITNSQLEPSVAMDAAGNFVVAWEDQRGSPRRINAQRYNAAGVPQGTEFRLDTTGGRNVSIAMDDDGDFVATWDNTYLEGASLKYGVFAQRFNAAGIAQGSEFRVNTYTTDDQQSPNVAMTADGNFMIAWRSRNQGDNGDGIFAQRYNAAGALLGSEFHVNAYTTGAQLLPAIAANPDGGYFISWSSFGQDNLWGVFARQIAADGTLHGSEFRVNTYTTNHQANSSVAVDAQGHVVVAWGSIQDSGGGGYGIYAQRYVPPAQVSEVRIVGEATALDEGERLIATIPAGPSLQVTFSDTMSQSGGVSGTNSIINPSNWQVTKNGVDISSQIIGISVAGNVATLTLAGNLTSGDYVLTARESLHVNGGGALDGDANGSAGGDFTRTFEISPPAAVGSEFRVNTYTRGNQQTYSESSAVATDAAGNFVITWTSDSLDGSYDNIFAQRYNSARQPLGSEFRVNTYTTFDQQYSSVAMSPAGDFVITWSSGQAGGSTDVYAQRYDSAGVRQGSEFRVNTYIPFSQGYSTVAMNAAGDFIVTWSSSVQDGSNQGVYAQRFDAVGQPQGSEFRVNTATTLDQWTSSVAINDSGAFVIAWTGLDDIYIGVRAQLYNSAGAPVGSEFLVNTYTTSDQTDPSVAMDASGDFAIVWTGGKSGITGQDIYAQRFNSAGQRKGSEFLVNTDTLYAQENPKIAMNQSGEFVVTWNNNSPNLGLWADVYARRFSATGIPQGSEFRVNQYTSSYQLWPSVAMDADGDFVVAWTGQNQDRDQLGVFARQFADIPQVTDFRVSEDTSSLDAAERLVSTIPAGSTLQVTFGHTMSRVGDASGVNSVTNLTNWRLSRNGVDVSYLITSIEYSGHTIQLSISAPLTSGAFVLTAKEAIQDTHGNALDGDANGMPGGDFVRGFTIVPPVAVGSEFQVNSYTTGSQRIRSQQSVAARADASFVVTWTSTGQDGDGEGVYAQRFNAAGIPQGSEFRVNAYTTGDQSFPAIAIEPKGQFIITWTSLGQDGSGGGVYAQRYTSTGAPNGSEFRVNDFTTHSQSSSAVAIDSSGQFVITWTSEYQDGDGPGVYARYFDSAGVPVLPGFLVNSWTSGEQISPNVATGVPGDFVITWTGQLQDGSISDIYAKRFTMIGLAAGSEFRVNAYTSGPQAHSVVAMDANNNFVAAWQSALEDGSGYGIYAQRYDSSSNPVGSEFQVNTTTTGDQRLAAISIDADGDFVIAWSSDDGQSPGVFAQRFNAVGIRQGSEFAVHVFTTASPDMPAIAMDRDGDFVVAWSADLPDSAGTEIRAQRFAESQSATTSLSLDGLNNLLIQDASSNDQTDSITIKSDTTNSVYIISDPYNLLGTTISGATGSGTHTLTIPFGAVTGPQISVLTLDGDDSLTIDFSLGNFEKTVVYDGGNQTVGDSLTITGGGTFAAVSHTFTSASSGSISVSGNALISYSSVEPITDNLSAADRAFTFEGGAETISLVDAAGANLTIASTIGKSVTFATPDGSLSINAGSGDDTINLTSVDAAFAAGVSLSGDAGNDTINLTANLTLASDRNLVASAETINLGNTTALVTSGNGTITLYADTLAIPGNATLYAGANTLTIAPQTSARPITLGNETVGRLSLTNLELSRLTAGTVQIGNETSGTITIDSPITPANNLSLTTGANSTINRAITMAADKSLAISALGNVTLPFSTSDIAATGSGAVTIAATRAISLSTNSSVTTVDGNLTIAANQQLVPGTGNFTGLTISSATVQVSGTGNLSLAGRGGNDSWGRQVGFRTASTSSVQVGVGSLTIKGQGGLSTGPQNTGVDINGTTNQIISNGGPLLIEATGGGIGTSALNTGFQILGGTITNAGTGANSTVTVIGVGGNAAGNSSSNAGLYMSGDFTQLTANGGALSLSGTGGGSSSTGFDNEGVVVISGPTVQNFGTGTNATVTLVGVAGGGDSIGATVTDAQLVSNGGALYVQGTGGGGGSGGGSHGVWIASGGVILNSGTSPSATVTVIGSGGASLDDSNIGVFVVNNDSLISSAGGNVTVQGTGGGAGTSSSNKGVSILSSGAIQATGPQAAISITGFGGNGTASNHDGVYLSTGFITATNGGDVHVTGKAGPGASSAAIESLFSSSITATGGNLTLAGDSMILSAPLSARATQRVTIRPRTPGVAIDLGVESDPNPGTLGISNSELNAITAAAVQFGDATAGTITISGTMSKTAGSNMALVSGGNIAFNVGTLSTGGGNLSLTTGAAGRVLPVGSGTDATTSPTSTLTFSAGSNLGIAVNGPTVHSQYSQLSVAGRVDLTGANLVFTGNYAPPSGQVLTIVDNDAADPVIGTFNGLAEGAVVNVNGADRMITYVGGSGNDVELRDVVLRVISLTSTPTGFIAEFNDAFDPSTLNLYDEGAALGAADVKLLDSALQEVRGSLLVDPSNRQITFIKSGGALLSGDYTVQLTSSANAFKRTSGDLLDGNLDSTPGGNYTGNFTIAASTPTTVTLAIPDFARGFGQSVNVPATAAGLPISISNALGVKSASFTLTYNPALLTITGALVGAGITGSVTLDTSVPGVAQISVTSPSGLSATAGLKTLVQLTASVPSNAPYSQKHLLDLSNLQILDTSPVSTALPADDDDGVHIAAYFGDANGSQSYNAPDATATQRLIVGSNSGLLAYQLADPYLIVDISGNGQVQSDDVTQIQRAIVGLSTPEIPSLPSLSPAASGGPDPIVSISQNLTASVGDTIAVPVELLVTEPTGITLAGADIAIAYDATVLELTDAGVGQLLIGFGLSVNTSVPGLIRLTLGGSPLDLDYSTSGVLATLQFTVLAGANSSTAINLLESSATLWTALYDDLGRSLTLQPAPTNADNDAVDGRVLIDTAAEYSLAVDAILGDEFDFRP